MFKLAFGKNPKESEVPCKQSLLGEQKTAQKKPKWPRYNSSKILINNYLRSQKFYQTAPAAKMVKKSNNTSKIT